MSVLIKSLTNGAPVKDTSLAAANDPFNVIATANEIYSLYTAPNNPTDMKAAIVKGIRLVNTHATAPVKITLYFDRPNASGLNRRRLLSPPDVELPAGFTYIEDGEITLSPGDKIQAKADTANVIQYVISDQINWHFMRGAKVDYSGPGRSPCASPKSSSPGRSPISNPPPNRRPNAPGEWSGQFYVAYATQNCPCGSGAPKALANTSRLSSQSAGRRFSRPIWLGNKKSMTQTSPARRRRGGPPDPRAAKPIR